MNKPFQGIGEPRELFCSPHFMTTREKGGTGEGKDGKNLLPPGEEL